MSEKIKFNVKNTAGAKAYAAGETIFKKGDPGDSMYIVVSGEVDIRLEDHVVQHLEEGDLFGEMGLIEKLPRVADAVARTDCSILKVDEQKFLYMTDHTPWFALRVMRLIASRLRERVAELEQLKAK
jgi:CRP-like cAMP-binding protein